MAKKITENRVNKTPDKNKIVRTVTMYNTSRPINEQYKSYRLMRYSEYIRNKQDKVYNQWFIEAPYKWYELQRFFTHQLFWILEIFKRNDLNLQSMNAIISSLIIFIIEASLSAIIGQIVINVFFKYHI